MLFLIFSGFVFVCGCKYRKNSNCFRSKKTSFFSLSGLSTVNWLILWFLISSFVIPRLHRFSGFHSLTHWEASEYNFRKISKIGLHVSIFPYFCPAILGKIGVARESAFFALFLIGESGQFAQEEVKRRGCFRCYVASNHTQHNQRSKSLIHIFLLVGVQTQPIEIRISLGGSALFACDESCLFESWRQNKNKQIYEVFW